MNIYAVSGLGADSRLFNQLSHYMDVIPLEYIEPLEDEAIQSYTKRLAKSIDTTEEFCLLGVSLGGLMVTEMNKFLKPRHTFLISSAAHYQDIKKLYRFLGFLHLDQVIPHTLFQAPAWVVNLFVGGKNLSDVKKLMATKNTRRTKWFVQQIIRWKNTKVPQNLVRIHGTKDRLMPFKNHPGTHVLKGGTHFIIHDEAESLAQIIRPYLA